MNLRPSGYEPDELPGCSTPRHSIRVFAGCRRRPDEEKREERVGGAWWAWRRPTLPPLERQYHRRSGFSRPSSGWDRVFGPALWPPGRQGCAAPRRPVVALACGVGGGRGLSCARGGNVLARLWGPPFPAFAGTGLTGACCRAGARQQGFAAVRGGIRRRRSAGVKRTLERLVPVSCAGCPASTSGLSTWWSSTALGETWF